VDFNKVDRSAKNVMDWARFNFSAATVTGYARAVPDVISP
jgi:hypothetical protein